MMALFPAGEMDMQLPMNNRAKITFVWYTTGRKRIGKKTSRVLCALAPDRQPGPYEAETNRLRLPHPGVGRSTSAPLLIA